MGEVFLTRRGGGAGGSANFRVITVATAPTTPASDNTIAVVTETPKNHVFMVNSADWAASIGDIAIEYEASAGFATPNFAIVKNPEVVAKPVSCKQYTAVGWELVEAYICIGGTWTQFSYKNIYIVKDGIVQDGYNFSRMIRAGANNNIASSSSGGILTLTPAAGYYTNGVASASEAPCGSKSRLVVEVESVGASNSTNYVELAIWTDALNVGTEKLVNEARKASIRISGAGTFKLDCAAYGNSYVGTYHHNGDRAVPVSIRNMYLE